MLYLNKIPERIPGSLAVDIETSSLDPYTGRLLSVAFSDGEDVWIILDIHGWDKAKKLLNDFLITFIAHNVIFEMKWFKQRFGIQLKTYFDTMLAEKVIDGGRGEPASLEYVLASRCGIVADKETRDEFADHPGFAVHPVTDNQLKYMMQDVLYLHEIKKQQEEELEKEEELERNQLRPVLELEHEVVPSVVEVELGGMQFDFDLWVEHVNSLRNLIDKADQELRELIGEGYVLEVPAKKKGESYIKEIPLEEINLNSPIQMRMLLCIRFGARITSTAKAVLQELVEAGDELGHVAELILEIRQNEKLVSFDYPKFVNSKTGRIHASYRQYGTATGRFSCNNPNLQQVPRPRPGNPNIRNTFYPDDNCVIMAVDYGQQEPRVFAQLCGDEGMIQACNQEDVYVEFAKILFGRDEISKEDRYIAKQFVLATGYGAGAKKLHAVSGQPLEMCEKTQRQIKRAFPKMAKFSNLMLARVDQLGYVITATGRRRYLDKGQFTEATNTPVQGTAADMMKIVLSRVWRFVDNERKVGRLNPLTRVWHTVHDEIVLQVHKDDVEYLSGYVKDIMEKAGHELCPDVKHIAEISISERWGG